MMQLEGPCLSDVFDVCLSLVFLLAALAVPGVARAAAEQDCMVDDASSVKPPAYLQTQFDKENAKYEQWLAQRTALQAQAADGVASAVQALASSDYSFCATISHKQIRSDYCGPATCTIIDDYVTGSDPYWNQNTWAAYRASDQNKTHLWTDASGAVMWVMAEGLRDKTGRGYAYTYGNSKTQVYNRTSYSLTTYHRCVAYGLRIVGSTIQHYVYNHTGHIVTGRGYDFRPTDPDSQHIYLEDSYPENEYQSGGGDTYGKKTYKKGEIGTAVVQSGNQMMIY